MTRSVSRPRFKPTGPLLALGLVAVLVTLAWLGLDHVFNLLVWLEQLIERHFWTSLLLFTLSFAGLALLTLPIGSLFCLAGGYFFGLGLGAAAALVGGTLGAALTYLMVRYGGGRALRERVPAGKAQQLLLLLERDATWYLILLRIIPIAPFFVINAAAGMARIGFGQFTAATLVGLVPTTLVYAGIGRGLGSVLQAQEQARLRLLLQAEVGLPLLALALIILLSWYIGRRLSRRRQ